MSAKRERPVRHLPAPAGGMYRAKRPTGLIVGVLVILLALIAGSIPMLVVHFIAVAKAVAAGQPSPTMPTEVALTDWPQFLMFAGIVLVVFVWVIAKEGRSLASFGFAVRTSTPNPAGSLPGTEMTRPVLPQVWQGAALALLMMAICVLVPVATGDATLQWQVPQLSTQSLAIVAGLLFWFLFQGSSEEILWRGFLTQVVARRWGLTAAVVAQAVLFAAMHGANPNMGALPVVNLVLYAVFMSFVTFATGSLWVACAFHGVWNWAQGCLFGVPVSGNALSESLFVFDADQGNTLITGGGFGIEGSLICTLLYALGTVVAVRLYRKRRAEVG